MATLKQNLAEKVSAATMASKDAATRDTGFVLFMASKPLCHIKRLFSEACQRQDLVECALLKQAMKPKSA